MALCESAAFFAFNYLKEGGNFVAKVLAGGAEMELQNLLKKEFKKASLASNLSGNPIMPLSKESMVSIARWVLPVFVGPRTAVILFLVISIFCASFFLPTRYCYC